MNIKESDIIISLDRPFVVKSSHEKDISTQGHKEIEVEKLVIRFLGMNGFMRYRKLLDELTRLCFKANQTAVELQTSEAIKKAQEKSQASLEGLSDEGQVTEDSKEKTANGVVELLENLGFFTDTIELIRRLFVEGHVYVNGIEKMIGLQIKIFEDTYSFSELEKIYRDITKEILKKSKLVSLSEKS